MNVLVTGATGFVGGHLVDCLLEHGDHVTALVRSATRAAPLAARGVRLASGDLDDTAAISAAVRDCRVVYHVAALTGAGSEGALMVANRDGTRHVAEACAAQPDPPRFVFVSSMRPAARHGAASRGLPTATTIRSRDVRGEQAGRRANPPDPATSMDRDSRVGRLRSAGSRRVPPPLPRGRPRNRPDVRRRIDGALAGACGGSGRRAGARRHLGRRARRGVLRQSSAGRH